MSDQVTHNVEEIERLLATRQELIGWLGRLDSAGARTPESVRSKVRADYRARLAHVVDRLRTHTDLVETTLGGLLSQSREGRQVRQQELEILAEAGVRHAVGELSDGQWQVIELESSGKIAGFDVELDRLGVEIHRLEGVEAPIAPPAAAGAPGTGSRGGRSSRRSPWPGTSPRLRSPPPRDPRRRGSFPGVVRLGSATRYRPGRP